MKTDRFLAASPLAASLALGIVTLAWRAAVDKLLAERGGAELVATWAQLQSIADLVSAVALAGIGPGISVLAAQSRRSDHRGLLREGLNISVTISGIALAIMVIAIALLGSELALSAELGVAYGAALGGLLAVGAGIANAYWTGIERRDLLLTWTACVGSVVTLVAWIAPQGVLVSALLIAYALPTLAVGTGLAVWIARGNGHGSTAALAHRRALFAFVLPSLSIGILSPASLIVIRTVTAESMSLADTGVMQAIWRTAEWVTHLSATVLGVYFLPRLSAARHGVEFHALLRRAMLVVLAPAACGFLGLWLAQGGVIAGLYNASFIASDRAVALFLLAEWLRLGSWLYLYAIYAVRATTAAAVGEILSLPLFAALVFAFRDHLDLETAALLYLVTFAVYLAFNYWVVGRRLRKAAMA